MLTGEANNEAGILIVAARYSSAFSSHPVAWPRKKGVGVDPVVHLWEKRRQVKVGFAPEALLFFETKPLPAVQVQCSKLLTGWSK